jgi:hypothetical protein
MLGNTLSMSNAAPIAEDASNTLLFMGRSSKARINTTAGATKVGRFGTVTGAMMAARK